MAPPWLALVVALAIPPHFLGEAASHASRRPALRQAYSQVEVASSWTTLGCFVDDADAHALTSVDHVGSASMTIQGCLRFCSPYAYAGLKGSQECHCANAMAHEGKNTLASDCSMPCAGNAKEMCGAADRLSIYSRSSAPPATVPSVGFWKSLGCYVDSTTARTLGHNREVSSTNTIEHCTTACYNAGYHLAGVEHSNECYCGNSFQNGGELAALGDCNMSCAGNTSESCGGVSRLNVYNYTGITISNPLFARSEEISGPSPIMSGLPSPWNYAACYVDNADGRVFSYQAPGNQNLTIESCIEICSSQNYTLAGAEYSTQCFCGDALVNGAAVANGTDCSMACGGNSTEACGGPNRLSVYSATPTVTVYPVPTVQETALPGEWTYQGCLQEFGNGSHIFPHQIFNVDNNTVDACLNQCALFGYPAAGLEYSDECYCGDISDTLASPGFAPASDCSMECSGDPVHLCGGPNRLQYYAWNGSLNVWHTPANTGRYEYLIGGVVVPLLVTLGVNNKVAMLEKFGTSEFDNSTGAYELDLTLVNNYTLAWRTMHVKSDVFCSASIVLPDKGGRQLNVGGWSLNSTMGVRLYTPDGTPGVNGTNDWEENWDELHLQRQRWYPSALLLSNGSVLVVGGEIGSNGAPEPSLEILPQPAGGPTWLFLDYLNRTDPNNLYPFLHVLPSGRIFIGYYNEARILDPVSLQTVQVLPNIPGSVISFLAGRTYPNEGTAVMLPQYAPYTDPVTILICGGSNFGLLDALDNCVSIQPEVENPTWTIERMPSPRVMPCIAALPDGTYLIVNGAYQGVAGFNLASNPNYNAILYDPTQPVSQRFSILNNTIVARLYHSEATLLYDGRVLISGSDPQSPNYPEEMRIEVYIPPYLTQGFTQPSFNITETDWAYGGTYSIVVTLYQGTTSTMRVSLVAATSSTHGNAMGGRTIFPQFACALNTCLITAPPNADVSPPGWHQLFILDGPTPSYSHWVRIGGDPAQLGNWPPYPDFTLPGV